MEKFLLGHLFYQCKNSFYNLFPYNTVKLHFQEQSEGLPLFPLAIIAWLHKHTFFPIPILILFPGFSHTSFVYRCLYPSKVSVQASVFASSGYSVKQIYITLLSFPPKSTFCCYSPLKFPQFTGISGFLKSRAPMQNCHWSCTKRSITPLPA